MNRADQGQGKLFSPSPTAPRDLSTLPPNGGVSKIRQDSNDADIARIRAGHLIGACKVASTTRGGPKAQPGNFIGNSYDRGFIPNALQGRISQSAVLFK